MPVGPTLKSIFNRVDANADGALDRAEVKKFVEDADVGTGLFAGKKVSGAVDSFTDQFDVNKDGKVHWDEFASKGRGLIPGAAQNATGAEITEAGRKLVERADANGDGALTRDEIKEAILPQLEANNVSMAGTKAEIGAKVVVHMLDENRDGKVGQAEVDSLAADIAAQLAAAREPR